MENPHLIFIGVTLSSLFLTLIILFSEKTEEILQMLTVFVPVILCLFAVLLATKKYWINGRGGSD